MTHIHRHEDHEGNLVDLTYFCSDWCHREHVLGLGLPYAWDGCHEIEMDEVCAYCGNVISGSGSN